MAAKKTDKKKEIVGSGAEQGEKIKALEHALAELDKSFGKGAVIKLGSKDFDHTIPVVSTGCLTLDAALGVGGLPKGRIIEIFGPESSGKTTVALHVVAEAQKKGGIAAFVDAEHALDPVYAKNLGVNVDELYVSQPESGEQALEITETLIRTGALDVVVVDSVAALTPRAEIDGEMGESFVGLQARLMSQALRKLTAVISKTQTCAIFINQLREKVGVMYGNPETTPGGRALKFYSSVRLDVRKADVLKDADKNLVGNHTKVKVVKNKVAPPFRVAEFDILYGKGISSESMILDMAVEKGLVEKSGAFYSYNGMRLGQGRDNARIFLETNPDVKNELDQSIRALLFAPDAEPMPAPESANQNTGEAESAEEDDDLLLLDDSEPEEEET